jgi:hypothetical protein
MSSPSGFNGVEGLTINSFTKGRTIPFHNEFKMPSTILFTTSPMRSLTKFTGLVKISKKLIK